jgi:hypothetical protein
MANRVVWSGLKEYYAELKQLPDACTGETEKLIEGEVNGAYTTVSQVYGAHRHTGTLQKRLTIAPLKRKGQFIAGRELRSGSPIAWLFDNGSQARHWASGKSTGTMWGKTPPTHIFAKTVAKARRALTLQYKAMLLRRGAKTVTGE